jgi:hypothetical protein
MAKLLIIIIIIILNIHVSLAQTYTEGIIIGIVLNKQNKKKTCKSNTIKNKIHDENPFILYQTADTELENNPYYHITQNHQCYKKKIINPLSGMNILLTIILIIFVVCGNVFVWSTTTYKEKSFYVGLFIGMLIDDLLTNECDSD